MKGASARLKARVLRAAALEAAPTRPVTRARVFLVAITGVVIALAIFSGWMGGVHFGDARHGVPERSPLFVAGTFLGWTAIAATATWLAFTRPTMLGRRRAWLLSLCVLTPAALFAWMLLCHLQMPTALAWVPARPGLKCLSFTIAMAAFPLVALAYVGRERNPRAAASGGAARGVAIGALAGSLVDLWCPITGPAHVLVGHIAPLVVLALLGALVGQMLTAVRFKAPRESSSRARHAPRW